VGWILGNVFESETNKTEISLYDAGRPIDEISFF
jgi:carotenoid cleavage dioxygenase-like enzyme